MIDLDRFTPLPCNDKGKVNQVDQGKIEKIALKAINNKSLIKNLTSYEMDAYIWSVLQMTIIAGCKLRGKAEVKRIVFAMVKAANK